MQRLEIDLIGFLHLHEPHGRSRGRLRDRFSADDIVLVRLDVGLHELRGYEAHLVTRRPYPPGKPLRPSTGGEVIRVGMPVDPGNLLVLGRIGDVPVIGAPGCACSPKENGFDWVMDRILAGDMPTAEDISGLGVGGLLMEIQTRPRPRDMVEKPPEQISVAIILLAAGKASRMGESAPHKLLAEFSGVPLVRRSAKQAISSGANSVTAVTGYRQEEICPASASALPIIPTTPPAWRVP